MAESHSDPQRGMLSCRQGDVFSCKGSYYIVISHCCDITAEDSKEPNIEVIQIELLADGQGSSNFLYGKNPRELHVVTNGVNSIYMKLVQTNKIIISKQTFKEEYTFSKEHQISENYLKLLVSWLSSRYQRHAFPENLTPRLQKLQSIIEKAGRKSDIPGIIAFLINVDPWNEELDDDDPYDIDIKILYTVDVKDGQANAQGLLDKIGDLDEQKGLCVQINIISDMELTYSDYRKFVEWKFEHISYKPIIKREL